MISVVGTVDKITIGEKKEGDLQVPALTVTIIVPIKGRKTVNDMYGVFRERANISFITTQASLNLDLGDFEPEEEKPEEERPEEEKPEEEKLEAGSETEVPQTEAPEDQKTADGGLKDQKTDGGGPETTPEGEKPEGEKPEGD